MPTISLFSLEERGGMAVFDRHPELLDIWPKSPTEHTYRHTPLD